MREVVPDADTWCPACERTVPEDSLLLCVICRGRFCPNCAVDGFGRQFCSTACRDLFFYGDGDEAEAES
jgi:hypothetical protein